MEQIACTVVTGSGATILLDLWAIARKVVLGTSPPNYGLVGRWLAHVVRGRIRHESIATSAPVRGERLIGWTAHYLTGIAFAAILLGVWGLAWVRHPTIGPALIVGIGTVVVPFLVTQPAMGAGVAASRTLRPAAARAQSVVTHAIFGFGLFASAWVARFVCLS